MNSVVVNPSPHSTTIVSYNETHNTESLTHWECFSYVYVGNKDEDNTFSSL